MFASVQVLVKSGFANSFHLFEFSLHYFRNAHTLQLKSLPRPLQGEICIWDDTTCVPSFMLLPQVHDACNYSLDYTLL